MPLGNPSRAELDLFIEGLDSPNHSEQTRREWCRLFLRDFCNRVPGPGLPRDAEVLRLRAAIAEADDFLALKGDPIAAHVTLHNALETG